MLFSLALIFILGFTAGKLFRKIQLPPLLGMLFVGIILGPYSLNFLDEKIISISSELRQIALVIILLRAGVNLNLEDLRKVGRPAVLLCFLPAVFEIIATTFIAPKILGIAYLDAALLGSVIAAVSPAVVVPGMLNLMDKEYGTKKGIPQMIMAGASVDDVFVIVIFSVLAGLSKGGNLNAMEFLKIPSAIILGILAGFLCANLLEKLIRATHLNNFILILMMLSVSFLLLSLETAVSKYIGFSGLLAIMSLGITLKGKNPDISRMISLKLSHLWIPGEILLFTLVGASVNLNYAFNLGIKSAVLIFLVLIFRILGVVLSVTGTNLNSKEKLFSAFSYMPKATVQAAIGPVPLAMGIASGNVILTLAVVSILLTAPLGSILIETFHEKLLEKN